MINTLTSDRGSESDYSQAEIRSSEPAPPMLQFMTHHQFHNQVRKPDHVD